MLQYAAAYSHPVAASVCFACGIATGAPSYPRESLLRHHTCASVWVTTAGHCPCEETYTGPKSISTEICSVYVLFRASMGRSAGAQAAATHCDSLHCMYASCLALCPRKYLTGPAHAFMHRVLSWMSRGGSLRPQSMSNTHQQLFRHAIPMQRARFGMRSARSLYVLCVDYIWSAVVLTMTACETQI